MCSDMPGNETTSADDTQAMTVYSTLPLAPPFAEEGS